MKFRLIIAIISLLVFGAKAQDTLSNSRLKQTHILIAKKASSEIKIDGLLSESTWENAQAVTGFWQKWPNNLAQASKQTEVKISFDNKFLYIGAICYDTSTYVIQTLKRDAGFFDSDGLGIVLDPMNAKSNGFFFGLSPYNVQSEDLISNNNFNQLTFSWDNKWYSATKRTPSYWTLEIAIPFTTLRFSPNRDTWGINFIRCDLKNNQYSTWTHMPSQFPGYDLGWTGALEFRDPLPTVGKNVSLIPFITGSSVKSEDETATKANAGIDAKVALGSSMNLDLTVNPDFSQIEVDRQVTNLTRFNIFLPERRTFFLENDDLFSEYGAPPFRPFYSRTIGLDKDGRKIPILGGMRLSGNLNKTLRVGLMNMQTGARGAEGQDNYTAPQNYTAATFNQRVGVRSIFKGYFLNKSEQSETGGEGKFGRNTGMEFSYTDSKGLINVWSGVHRSFKPTQNQSPYFTQIGGGYFGRNITAFADFDYFGKTFYTDMGYVSQIESFSVPDGDYNNSLETIRQGLKQNYVNVEYNIRPVNKMINRHQISVENFTVWRENNVMTDNNLLASYGLNFKNTQNLKFTSSYSTTRLQFYTPLPSLKPLDPGLYEYWQNAASFSSDFRKPVNFTAQYNYGGFYNGKINSAVLGLNARKQPWGNFSLSYELNDLNFPDTYGDERLTLFNSRSEINFNNKMFWTTFLQYNTQRSNFNINSRLQWRYKPMSDFFLVYTDNYLIDNSLQNRDRAIVFKLNYWFTAAKTI